MSNLENLEEFWCNDNKISDWEQLEKLSVLKKLRTLYMERNPIYFLNTDRTKHDSNYRRKILLALPNLQQLDANLTGVGI